MGHLTSVPVARTMSREPCFKKIAMCGGVVIALVLVFADIASCEVLDIEYEDPLAGRRVFVQKGCIRCHNVLGEVDSLGPDLTNIGKGSTLAKLAGLFWSHSPRMIDLMEEHGIPYPTFTEDEMKQVMAYLYFLSYFEKPGDYIEGKRIFESKQCGTCHAIGGQGGSVGPSLDEYSLPLTSDYLLQEMWNHGAKMTMAMRDLGIERPTFVSGELPHLVAYIQGAALNIREGSGMALPGNPRSGEQVFMKKGCGQCHGSNDGLKARGPNLESPERGGRAASDIAEQIWNHGVLFWNKVDEPQAQGIRFEGTEMPDLIAYLHFLPSKGIHGDPASGRQLFVEKGCASCHDSREHKASGPNLANSAARRSLTSLTTAMWNHAPFMRDMLEKKALTWPLFFENEMQDILSFLKSMNREASP